MYIYFHIYHLSPTSRDYFDSYTTSNINTLTTLPLPHPRQGLHKVPNLKRLIPHIYPPIYLPLPIRIHTRNPHLGFRSGGLDRRRWRGVDDVDVRAIDVELRGCGGLDGGCVRGGDGEGVNLFDAEEVGAWGEGGREGERPLG